MPWCHRGLFQWCDYCAECPCFIFSRNATRVRSFLLLYLIKIYCHLVKDRLIQAPSHVSVHHYTDSKVSEGMPWAFCLERKKQNCVCCQSQQAWWLRPPVCLNECKLAHLLLCTGWPNCSISMIDQLSSSRCWVGERMRNSCSIVRSGRAKNFLRSTNIILFKMSFV